MSPRSTRSIRSVNSLALAGLVLVSSLLSSLAGREVQAGVFGEINPGLPFEINTAAADRSRTTPTGWFWYTNASVEFISQRIRDENLRIIDLEVESSSPLRFSVVFVRNTGVYQKAWWWYVGQTVSQVSDRISAHNARLIDVNAYEVGGQVRYAVVMIPNTGVDQKAWWWYVGTDADGIADRVARNRARIVDLDRYTVGGRTYRSVIMIRNSGSDASGWWYYYGQTASQVSALLNTHRACILDLETYSTSRGPRFDVVLLPNTGAGAITWWWYYNVSTATLSELTAQNGARIVDLERMPNVGGQRRYAALLLRNTNSQTSRLASLLRYGADGRTGVYVKRVGGAVEASLQPRAVFEPASTIKALPHFYALFRMQSGFSDLDDQVPFCNQLSGSCPVSPPCNSGSRSLEWLLRQMMWYSDNAATDAIVRHLERDSINFFGEFLGMDSTQIHHVLGCGGPTANQLTLADITWLYERSTTVLNDAHQEIFRSLMSGKNDTIDFTGAWGSLSSIIDEEGAALGLSSQERAAFKSRVRFANKAGGYQLWRNGRWEWFTSNAGWIRLPTCPNGSQVDREYVFGFFVDGATNEAGVDARFRSLRGEILREQLRSALAQFSLPCAGPDEPARGFVRGDVDLDGQLNLTDGLMILASLFLGGDDPECEDAADVNDSGRIDVADASALFGFLFLGSAPPAGAAPGQRQTDRTQDALGCDFYPPSRF